MFSECMNIPTQKIYFLGNSVPSHAIINSGFQIIGVEELMQLR